MLGQNIHHAGLVDKMPRHSSAIQNLGIWCQLLAMLPCKENFSINNLIQTCLICSIPQTLFPKPSHKMTTWSPVNNQSYEWQLKEDHRAFSGFGFSKHGRYLTDLTMASLKNVFNTQFQLLPLYQHLGLKITPEALLIVALLKVITIIQCILFFFFRCKMTNHEIWP